MDHQDGPPEVGEDEAVENLRPRTRGGARSRYADGRQVERGARQAAALLRSGSGSGRLLDALVGALDHDQPHARAAVARVLAGIDRAEAREALVAELLSPGGTAEVRHACLAGLRAQVASAPSPAVRAARRWRARDAAHRAVERGLAAVAAELGALADDAVPDGLVVDHGAFEVADLTRTGLRVVLDARPRLRTPHLPVSAADRRAAGPDWEQKYSVAELDLPASGVPVVRLTPGSWRDGNAFHRAMRRTADVAPEQVDHLAEGWLRARSRLPGLAAAHAVVVTADDRVVLARRSGSSAYAPGTWAAGIEEQVTDDDLRAAADASGAAVFAAAACRGVREELGATTAVRAVTPLSLVVEMPILGAVPVLLVRLRDDAAALRAARAGGAHDHELVDLADLACDPEAIERYLRDPHPPGRHPTTAIRLLLLRRHLLTGGG